MKDNLIKGLVLLILLGGAGWTGYSIGLHHRSEVERRQTLIEEAMTSPDFELGLVLEQKGTFVSSFSALQKLRPGDIDGGIRDVERMCFSAADPVYGKHPETRIVANLLFDDFRHYFQTYCTNRATLTSAEQNLQRNLADWK